MLVLQRDVAQGVFIEEHLESALAYALEEDRETLRASVKKYIEAGNAISAQGSLMGSCMTEFYTLCETAYLSGYVNLHDGFLTAKETMGERVAKVVYVGSAETAWYTGTMLGVSASASGQRGIFESGKRKPGYYSDSNFLLANGGSVAFNDFALSYSGENLLVDYFAQNGEAIEASASNSAGIRKMWASPFAVRNAFATVANVTSGAYKYTNIERATYFAYSELVSISDFVYLRRDRSATEIEMERLVSNFGAWMASRGDYVELADDRFADALSDKMASGYYYGE